MLILSCALIQKANSQFIDRSALRTTYSGFVSPVYISLNFDFEAGDTRAMLATRD